MPEVLYRGRRAHRIENELLHVTVTVEGGHIAEILHKETGVNPLWSTPWETREPSTYDPAKHPEYGLDAESQLLSGILGHNLCLDLFGPPSPEEAAAGMTVHGEASVARYQIESSALELTARCDLPAAQLKFERRITLTPASDTVQIHETVENMAILDRPVAWTQHVTLGPPFLEKGLTRFDLPGTKSQTIEGELFDWPMLPQGSGAPDDLRVFTSEPSSSRFSTHLMDPGRDTAYFRAWSPTSKVLFGYDWQRTDFPWIGIWEENYSRQTGPWNGRTLTRGLEFGASPIPEPRRKMIARNTLFGTPCYRWIPARTRVEVAYSAFIRTAQGL